MESLPNRAPSLPYITEGEGKKGGEGRKGESYSTLSFPFPSFHHLLGRPIWGAHQPLVAGVFPLLAHKAHIFCRGCPEPLPVTRYVPGTPRTLPVSEYYRPIYESLPPDHFETPRHVRDVIRDSEQHSVTTSHKSYNINRHRTLSVRTLRVR